MYLSFSFPYLPCPLPFKSKFLDLEPERELGVFKTKKDNGVVTQPVTKEATQGSGRAAIPEPLTSGELDSTSTAFFHTTHNLPHHKTKLLLQRQKSTCTKTIHCAQNLLDCQLLIICNVSFSSSSTSTPIPPTTHNPNVSPSTTRTNSTNRQYFLVKALFHTHKVSSLFIVS
jgi:hypothetical protein